MTMMQSLAASPRKIREVWAWNLDEELSALTCAVANAGQSDAVLAMDFEFPGFLWPTPGADSSHEARYGALRANINLLWPIQLGLAVASSDGKLGGVWSFNLKFDVAIDRHSKESVTFLQDAGVDFPRHKNEGIEAVAFGFRLARSGLVGQHSTPCWLTFSGLYDLGYLVKLLTSGDPLPMSMGRFEAALAILCPVRRELRDHMKGCGSLDSFARRYDVQRHGAAHTAGSDALLTLEIYLRLKDTHCLMQPEWNAVNPWAQSELRIREDWSSDEDAWYEQSRECISGLDTFPVLSAVQTQACHPSVCYLMSSLGEAVVPWNAAEQAWCHVAYMPGALHVTSR